MTLHLNDRSQGGQARSDTLQRDRVAFGKGADCIAYPDGTNRSKIRGAREMSCCQRDVFPFSPPLECEFFGSGNPGGRSGAVKKSRFTEEQIALARQLNKPLGSSTSANNLITTGPNSGARPIEQRIGYKVHRPERFGAVALIRMPASIGVNVRRREGQSTPYPRLRSR
jgi:hypothetical protein